MNIEKEILSCNCNNKHCKEYISCGQCPTECCYCNNTNKIDIFFIGQGMGKKEEELRLPFVGRAGAYLRGMIKSLWDDGILFNVAFSNTVRFHPMNEKGKDRNPTESEINECLHILYKDINILRPKYLITLGLSTTYAILPSVTGMPMGRLQGLNAFTNIHNQKYTVRPMYHPSFLTRTYGKFKKDQTDSYHVKCMNLLREII